MSLLLYRTLEKSPPITFTQCKNEKVENGQKLESLEFGKINSFDYFYIRKRMEQDTGRTIN